MKPIDKINENSLLIAKVGDHIGALVERRSWILNRRAALYASSLKNRPDRAKSPSKGERAALQHAQNLLKEFAPEISVPPESSDVSADQALEYELNGVDIALKRLGSLRDEAAFAHVAAWDEARGDEWRELARAAVLDRIRSLASTRRAVLFLARRPLAPWCGTALPLAVDFFDNREVGAVEGAAAETALLTKAALAGGVCTRSEIEKASA